MTFRYLREVIDGRLAIIKDRVSRRHYYLDEEKIAERIYKELIVLMYKEDRDYEYFIKQPADKGTPIL